jgi:hypothetical protein
VKTPNDQDWKAILAVILDERKDEVHGRGQESIPEELRVRLKQLVEGNASEAAVRAVCEEIAGSSEAMKMLAQLLKESEPKKTRGEPT